MCLLNYVLYWLLELFMYPRIQLCHFTTEEDATHFGVRIFVLSSGHTTYIYLLHMIDHKACVKDEC